MRTPSCRSGLALEAETAKKEAESLKFEMCSGITVSIEEYESLIQKAKMANEKTAVLPSRDESLFFILKVGLRSMSLRKKSWMLQKLR